MALKKILVIDDDMDICHLLRRFLTKNGYEVATAHSGASGLSLLETEGDYDLIMTDFRLGDMDGIELIGKIKTKLPQSKILVITGYSDIRTAVRLMKMGAYDYVAKPIIPQEILLTIQKALDAPVPVIADTTDVTLEAPPSVSASKTSQNNSQKAKTNEQPYIIGGSQASLNLMRQVDLVAPTNYSIIIYGESGAGKEVIARLIHDRSKRKNQPFVGVDCGAIPRDLANSELFGHEKGSFTGAIGSKEGYFEMANGGTIFLDEVANLPYDVQVALLRVVQERKCRRVGGSKEINLDVRIIVASNERLSDAARKGKFREDLYHRFNEFSIDAPPLRARQDDIMLFADKFLGETQADLNKTMVGFDEDVVDIFKTYPWPGNVRELKNVIKRAALLSTSNRVQAKALPFEIINYAQLNFGYIETGEEEEKPSFQAAQTPIPVLKKAIPTPFPSNRDVNTVFEPKTSVNLKETAQKVEYDAIMKTLEEVRFNKSKAAEVLGIDRKTLYNKLKKLGIDLT